MRGSTAMSATVDVYPTITWLTKEQATGQGVQTLELPCVLFSVTSSGSDVDNVDDFD